MKFLGLLFAADACASVSDLLAPRQDLGAIGEATCTEIGKNLAIENVTVNIAEYLPAGSNITLSQDYNLPTCGYKFVVNPVDMCRLAMRVETSNQSEITLEAWLPTNWTGRFLSTGNGGLSGCIQYPELAYTVGLGFATVGGNNGHNGTSGQAFYNNLDIVHDFADRSIHTGVVVGKEITAQYYGCPHKKSYFVGCSTGGRQVFKAVQSYPEDFDGVVAGAPAFSFIALLAWSGHFYPIFGDPGNSKYVPAATWTAIHEEVLKQCDGIDGVVDGILEDPSLCNFRPEAMLCSGDNTNSTTCLTPDQAGAVREAYSDYYGADGKLIYPKIQPGGEQVAARMMYTNGPFPYTSDWYKYVVYKLSFNSSPGNPDWDPKTFSIADYAAAFAQNPFNIDTWDGDLSAFQNRGGKVLSYHGEQDGIISSLNSPRYYNHVSRTMGKTSDELDDFYRLFRVGGMGHCYGGDGTSFLGQQGSSFAGDLDPQNNVVMRIVDWIENGNAPETITGKKYVNGVVAQGVELVRNHCKYPLRNVCIDPANYTKAEAWACIV
ncbi:hypothetical protein HYALB_00000099 [Hymenoscyphus albidus]|uniref:Carboxylic ester hydrolase n=1 Tax=Hymenoscyphus albidus TaxID=595503 RepID=A0A9N9Q4K7_9HELO|nr:hypothetical protein HYALB_00000099 [Hymenoscyphus albidus]